MNHNNLGDRSGHDRRPDIGCSLQCSQEELQEIIKSTVQQTLLSMGLDISDPIKLQRDFTHLRDWREGTEALRKNGTLGILAFLGLGILSFIVLSVKEKLGIRG